MNANEQRSKKAAAEEHNSTLTPVRSIGVVDGSYGIKKVRISAVLHSFPPSKVRLLSMVFPRPDVDESAAYVAAFSRLLNPGAYKQCKSVLNRLQ